MNFIGCNGTPQENDASICQEYFNLDAGCIDETCDGLTRCVLSMDARNEGYATATKICEGGKVGYPFSSPIVWLSVNEWCAQCCNYCPTNLK